MSLIFITHHNENVFDYEEFEHASEKVVNNIEAKEDKPYVSKYKKLYKKTFKQPFISDGPNGLKLIRDHGTHERRTMGCAYSPICPKDFLRKNSGIKWQRIHQHVCPKSPRSPSIPRVADLEPHHKCIRKQNQAIKKESMKNQECIDQQQQQQQQQQLPFICACVCPPVGHGHSIPLEAYQTTSQPCSSRKPSQADQLNPKPDGMLKNNRCKRINFIALNRKRAIESQPKRPPPRIVDTPNGYRQNLVNSGLIPQYACNKNFARVPSYLAAHKKLLRRYRDACIRKPTFLNDCEAYMNQQGYRKMTNEERVEIIKGLRENLQQQVTAFQKFSLYYDTEMKKVRITNLEKYICQLEADIKFLEDNYVIFVMDDQEEFGICSIGPTYKRTVSA